MEWISSAQVRIPPSPLASVGSVQEVGAGRGMFWGQGIHLAVLLGEAALLHFVWAFVRLAVFPVRKLCSCPPTPSLEQTSEFSS